MALLGESQDALGAALLLGCEGATAAARLAARGRVRARAAVAIVVATTSMSGSSLRITACSM